MKERTGRVASVVVLLGLLSQLKVCNTISVGFEYRFFAEGALVPASMLPVMIGLVSPFLFGFL
jgi:hypothetical protein